MLYFSCLDVDININPSVTGMWFLRIAQGCSKCSINAFHLAFWLPKSFLTFQFSSVGFLFEFLKQKGNLRVYNREGTKTILVFFQSCTNPKWHSDTRGPQEYKVKNPIGAWGFLSWRGVNFFNHRGSPINPIFFSLAALITFDSVT